MSLFRSWMFVPGSDSKKLSNIPKLFADVIIYDLEDSVAPEEKESARLKVKAALRDHQHRYQVIRVNGMQTSFFEKDVKQLVSDGINGIMLPKVESKDQIDFLIELLEPLEKELGIGHSISIIPIIESALGVCKAQEIASASERVQCLAFGSIDYTLDIGAELTKEGFELLYARSHLVNVSRAAAIAQPIDGVNVDLGDLEGLKSETMMIKKMGFQGKLIVHPGQIEPVHRVFMPSEDEIERAMAIVEAYELSIRTGRGAAVRVDGKMVDLPVFENARRIIEKAKHQI